MIDDFRPAHAPEKSVPVKIDTIQTKKLESMSMPQLKPGAELFAADPPRLRPTQPTNLSLISRLQTSLDTHRKKWIIGSALVLLFSFMTGAVAFKFAPKPVAQAEKPAITVKKKVAPKPVPITSTLSGLPVDASVNQRHVTGVMIENSLAARPQSGLSQASVVFEAIAEGGITRFLALFQDTTPEDVGPIRSARPYYEQWALGFDAAYAHVGGSPAALANIKEWGVKDLDQFANGGSYHRITSRPAPHNVYTSIAALQALEASKGYTTSTFTGFPRKPDAAVKQPNAKAITMNISGPAYNVHYDYNAATNSYGRVMAGVAHLDAAGNTQIAPKVVIGLIMPYSLEADGYHSAYNTIGTGAAYIFQDGIATIGQWNKAANNAQFTFTDAAGKPILLNPGQTWITALRGTNEITYTP
ncbi:MAG: DUF3048 domain-containing protein [Patescibacteria group bacterium]|nr:DUF3048 domain-containing protein [Patescibacteria group bacterium]